jgi:hypothetical protein
VGKSAQNKTINKEAKNHQYLVQAHVMFQVPKYGSPEIGE